MEEYRHTLYICVYITTESVNLREEVDSTEESEPEVWVSGTGLDSGLVLNNPEGKVNGDSLVPQEIKAFVSGIGLKQIPEFASNPHSF